MKASRPVIPLPKYISDAKELPDELKNQKKRLMVHVDPKEGPRQFYWTEVDSVVKDNLYQLLDEFEKIQQRISDLEDENDMLKKILGVNPE